jgi:hypothetical protein
MLVLPFEEKLGDEIGLDSPDHYLIHAPVQVGLEHPWFLPSWRRAWETPMLRFAAPLRDLALYGSFYSIRYAVSSDVYEYGPHGDRISYNLEQSGKQLLRYRREFQVGLSAPLSLSSTPQFPTEVMLTHYFAARDVAAARELKTMTARDGCQLVLVAHGPASLLLRNPPLRPSFRKARREFFTALADGLGVPLHFFLDTFGVKRYAISDNTHLNRYGAAAFSKRLAESLLNRPADDPPVPLFPSLDITDHLTFDSYSFVLLRRGAADGTRLRLRFVHSMGVPPLSNVILFVALRTPDGEDIIAPARLMPDEEVVASFRELPANGFHLYIGRLLGNDVHREKVALSMPLGGYQWEHE